MAIIAYESVHRKPPRARWRVALAATSFVAIAGFALALHQFVLKFLYDQSSYTRTIGGILFILLGVVGIGVPVVLCRGRQRFLSLRAPRQWILAISIPLAHALVLAVCLGAAQRSRTLILPRPFTPTAIVRYRPGDTRVEFRGGWKRHVGPYGYNDADALPDGSERFSSYLAVSFMQDAMGGRETVAILGRANCGSDGSVRIVLDVDAREAIRFAVENLDDVRIERDGRAFAESRSQSGIFQVTLTGRSRNSRNAAAGR